MILDIKSFNILKSPVPLNNYQIPSTLLCYEFRFVYIKIWSTF